MSKTSQAAGRIPAAAWTQKLETPAEDLPEFSVTLKEGLKLAPLGYRMNRFISKQRKEGKEPFMDPFCHHDVHTNVGVPLGGIGAGTMGRGYQGDFNTFMLRPGPPQERTVKANQFSLYVKREGHHSHAIVLGCPVGDLAKAPDESDTEDVITMPHAEKLPDDVAGALAGLPMDVDCENEEEMEDVDINSPKESLKAAVKEAKQQEKAVPKGLDKSNGHDDGADHHNPKKPCHGRKTTFISAKETLSGWNWTPVRGTYHGLFPRAWTTYDVRKLDKRLHVTCKQMSPVIAGNYKESSFPVTAFVWEIENTHPTKAVDVSLMLTFQNGVGSKDDYAGGHHNVPFKDMSTDKEVPSVVGVNMINNRTKVVSLGPKDRATYQDPLSIGIAAGEARIRNPDGTTSHMEGAALSCNPQFETTGLGKALWAGFSHTGKALSIGSHHMSHSVEGVGIGGAVSSKVSVPPNTTVEICFSLSWDQPVVRFGLGRGYHPRYTRYYGISGIAAPKMCMDTIRQWQEWDRQIEQWQNQILMDEALGQNYKCSLFNQLYYIVAGGSVWLNQEETEATRLSLCLTDTREPRRHKHISKKKKAKACLMNSAQTLVSDFLSLTEDVASGVMLYTEILGAGKIIFSLEEINCDREYRTVHGHKLVRSSKDANIITLDDTVFIHIEDEDPDSHTPEVFVNSEGVNYPPKPDEEAPGTEQIIDPNFGQLLYLESVEYQMYNTFDVHFYSSFALVMLWPELELNLQRDFARAALVHTPHMRRAALHGGEEGPRKIRGAIPHDVGCPGEDPMYLTNSYCIHNVNNWKDLNSKFALQIYRDYVATKNLQFLEDMFPVVWECMLFLERFDQDRDGLIENENFPDQTYDTWTVTGISAYCGGLWLAALSATAEMAKILNRMEEETYFRALLAKGKEGYVDALWNGTFFRYDASGDNDATIMADQLAGQWYARSAGLPSLFPEESIKSALLSIYKHNFLKFHHGRMGVVNGWNTSTKTPEGDNFQASEVWTGTTYGFAACLFQEGMQEEAWAVVNSMHKAIYRDLKYWYQVPEAWDAKGRFRAYSYMRPLAIWAVQWAVEIDPSAVRPVALEAPDLDCISSPISDGEEARETKTEDEAAHADDEQEVVAVTKVLPELNLREPDCEFADIEEPSLDQVAPPDNLKKPFDDVHPLTTALTATDIMEKVAKRNSSCGAVALSESVDQLEVSEEELQPVKLEREVPSLSDRQRFSTDSDTA